MMNTSEFTRALIEVKGRRTTRHMNHVLHSDVLFGTQLLLVPCYLSPVHGQYRMPAQYIDELNCNYKWKMLKCGNRNTKTEVRK